MLPCPLIRGASAIATEVAYVKALWLAGNPVTAQQLLNKVFEYIQPVVGSQKTL